MATPLAYSELSLTERYPTNSHYAERKRHTRVGSTDCQRLLRIWSMVPVYIDIGTSLDVG